MDKNTLGVGLVIVAIVVIGALFLWQRPHGSSNSTRGLESISNINTPAGWYTWGKSNFPQNSNVPTTVTLTFGNQPMDTKGNNSTNLIVVTAHNSPGETKDQWISKLSNTLASLDSATSTQSWETINGMRMLKAQTMTPAGGYNLGYYFFSNGVEYSFNLEPSSFSLEYKNKNLASSPDAQVLRAIVGQFKQ